MTSRWLVTPFYFEHPEPALFSAAPDRVATNAPDGIADRSPGAMARLHRPIARFVEQTLRAGARPVSLAGDCCAAVPVLAGLRAAGIEPALVWIDAHGDFNTPETSPSQFLGGMPLAMMVGRGPQWMCQAVGLAPLAEERVWLIDAHGDFNTPETSPSQFLGGMPLAMMVGRGPQWLCQAVGLAPLPEERVWLIDGRDLDPLERAALDASRVNRAEVADLATLELAGPVHVHIDLDVLDATEAPGFNYPVPGGPGVAETVEACAALAARADIRAVSISGWSEALDPGGATGTACRRVLLALTGEGPGG